MASEDHKVLANNIKTVHKHLRERVLMGEDVENVWKNHVENIEVLNKYAKSMEELATKHWLNQENSRIWWIFKQIENYFWLGGIDSEHLKDVKIAKKKGEIIEICENVEKADRLKVLDVGSCYNPFGAFHRLGRSQNKINILTIFSRCFTN
jgi:25S rRNA (adenine2142-N1)-methyltransferase